MNRNEVEVFVNKKLAECPRFGVRGVSREDVITLAHELYIEFAKRSVSAFVDQLQAEGWEKKEVSTNIKVWDVGDTYETIEFQVFQGSGKYQIFVRPKPGENNAKSQYLDLDSNGNAITGV